MNITRLIAGLLFVLAATPAFATATTTFHVNGTDPGPWRKIFGAVGIAEVRDGDASTIVLGSNDLSDVLSLSAKHLVIIEGTGPAAQKAGIIVEAQTVSVRQICDNRAPKIQIIWERSESVPMVKLPADFQVFARERWKGTPVIAGKRTDEGGAILWVATAPGPSGSERYPYLLQAAADLGLQLPLRATQLWAFFDSAYRIRADVDYLAQRWRKAGMGVLHVAAWHNMEPDATQDEYLTKLIEACHRNAILVYAWLELPHVSEKFWADHPEWREKTALGQDAQLDWRKLMNLQNPDCHREIEKELGALLQRFDWDGVNVGELYFESLEGASNPARFTPFNDNARAEFKGREGFDPKLLFDPSSPYERDPEQLRKFLDFRARLASRMQTEWLDVLGRLKMNKPYLDIVLTHIDDRFDPGIRDALGADVARTLPVVQARRSTLLVEDPAPLWGLGAERYSKLAGKYNELTKDRQHLAVDINVVERYQDVYPTKKQTGMELLELVHEAAHSFARVALYFENSLEKQDLSLLPAAATIARIASVGTGEFEMDAAEPTRVAWHGPVKIDGKPWPVQDTEYVLVPAGKHRLTAATELPVVTLTDFNGDLQSAIPEKTSIDLAYVSHSRAIAKVNSPIASVEVD
ncbi:MAG: hypothetical protein JOY85_15600, partial [Acidobacteriaceae bacterium]|nr:hypothetical protein [Acidobacteriaceae bacterium]